MNNGTRIQIGPLSRTDTGAYACRVQNKGDSSIGQDVSSLLVQDEPVAVEASDGGSDATGGSERLWLFHGNGVSIYSGGCGGLLHEINGRDILPQSGLALCGASGNEGSANIICQWSESVVEVNGRIYIGQPNLDRIVVFHTIQLNVVQIIAADPRPNKLWKVKASSEEDQIWVLCNGEAIDELEESKRSDPFNDFEDNYNVKEDSFEFDWNLPSEQQKRHNRKTVQVIRISSIIQQQNVIHLQPVDGHFDLVYDLFVPSPSTFRQRNHENTNR